MSWMNQIASVLQNYSQGSAPSSDADVTGHFNQVAQAAPPDELADGVAAMFRSDKTPPFGQMLGQLFGNSNGNQRANLLNTLMSSGAGAGILGQLAQTAGISVPTDGTPPQITPEAAARVTPEMVQQAAAQAEKHDPSIVDRVSQLYAQHPALISTLGTLAMSMAISHLANRRS